MLKSIPCRRSPATQMMSFLILLVFLVSIYANVIKNESSTETKTIKKESSGEIKTNVITSGEKEDGNATGSGKKSIRQRQRKQYTNEELIDLYKDAYSRYAENYADLYAKNYATYANTWAKNYGVGQPFDEFHEYPSIQQSTISPTHSMEFGYGQQGTSTSQYQPSWPARSGPPDSAGFTQFGPSPHVIYPTSRDQGIQGAPVQQQLWQETTQFTPTTRYPNQYAQAPTQYPFPSNPAYPTGATQGVAPVGPNRGSGSTAVECPEGFQPVWCIPANPESRTTTQQPQVRT